MANDSVITKEKLKEYHERYVYPFLNGITAKGNQPYVPCGQISAFMRTTPPAGYLICDGSEYDKSQYPSLATILGIVDADNGTSIFVGSSATKFKVPDLRGEFLRGTGTNGHVNQGNGSVVGVHQDATTVNKIVTYPDYSVHIYSLDQSTDYESSVKNYETKNEIKNVRLHELNGTTTTTSSAYEYSVRPTNTSVLYCIAYENIYPTQVDSLAIAEAYDETKSYLENRPITIEDVTTSNGPGDVVVYNGKRYRCVRDTTPGPFDQRYWKEETVEENVSYITDWLGYFEITMGRGFEQIDESLGSADISAIGDGSVKGAISQINTSLSGSSSTTTNTYCGNFNLYKIGKLVICTGYVTSTQVFTWDAILGIIPDGYKPTTYVSAPLIFDNEYSGIVLLAPTGEILSHNIVANTIGQYVTINAVWSTN